MRLFFPGGSQMDDSAVVHGLGCIIEEVQDAVSQHLLINPQGWEIGVDGLFNLYILLCHAVADQRQNLGQQLTVRDQPSA